MQMNSTNNLGKSPHLKVKKSRSIEFFEEKLNKGTLFLILNSILQVCDCFMIPPNIKYYSLKLLICFVETNKPIQIQFLEYAAVAVLLQSLKTLPETDGRPQMIREYIRSDKVLGLLDEKIVLDFAAEVETIWEQSHINKDYCPYDYAVQISQINQFRNWGEKIKWIIDFALTVPETVFYQPLVIFLACLKLFNNSLAAQKNSILKSKEIWPQINERTTIQCYQIIKQNYLLVASNYEEDF